MSDEALDWKAALPEELREAPYFKSAKSLQEAADGIKSAAYWQGNSILKPTAEASDEAKATNQAKLRELYPNLVDPEAEDVFARLGKPEDHTKYDVPEGVTIGTDELVTLKQLAYSANMTKKQFKDYIGGLDTARKTGAEITRGAILEQQSQLRSEWGDATDVRKAEVARYLKGDSSIPKHLLNAHEAGTLTAAEYKWLFSLARSGDESPEATSGGKGTQGAMTVMEGLQKAREIRGRMFNMSPSDPMYPLLTKQLVEADKAAAAGRG